MTSATNADTDAAAGAGNTVNSLCAYCGVGCGMVLEVDRDGTDAPVIAKTIGRKDHPSNYGRLCTKGATTADMLAGGGRLTTALVRTERGAPAEVADLDATITATAARLRGLIDEHGPDAVALYVSGQMSMEAQYLSNKLAKGFIGTNQIESNSRLCMASAGTGYKQSLGADGPPGSYQDFDHADVFFVIGSNMADCHPILFMRMMDRVKAGATLIVADPRRTATAEKADLYLPVNAGTDLALLNGLLHLLISADKVDVDFIAEFTDGFEQLPDFAAQYPPETVAEITGIGVAELQEAAELIGNAQNWMSCWTMGLNQSTHGTWNTNALINLHLATGAICRLGSGPFSLTGQPNAMGGREMGYMGPGLPGQRAVLSAEDRAFVEERWGLTPDTLRTDVGGGTIDMFSTMAGRDKETPDIKACWVICTNPVASVANRKTVIEALERAELVITQDAFADTETNAYADVALPAALWTESSGTMVNSERNVTLFEPAVPAPGQALPDWQLIARIACEMGYADAFSYTSAEEIFEEIKGFANPRTGYDLRGISFERLRKTPVQWPAPPESARSGADDQGRNPIRYLNDGVSQTLHRRPDGSVPRLAFATPNRRAQFFARPHIAPAEMPDDDYPVLLNTGRLPHQWHTLTKTGRVAKLNKLNPGPFVEVHPADAERYGIVEADRVEVASRRGKAVLPARISDRVRPGNVFVPFHWNDVFGEHLAINAVTSDAVDADSQQPEFKVCAVTVTRVGGAPAAAQTDDRRAAAAVGPAEAQTAGVRPADVLGLAAVRAPTPSEDEKLYLAGVFAGIEASPQSVGASAVPTLPSDAPLRPQVRQYVLGVLAGMYARTGLDSAESVERGGPAVVVAWASQMGAAEEYADTVADRLRAAGCIVETKPMAEVEIEQLSGSTTLFVTSTTGDGDPPDNATDFWQTLSGDAPPLDGLRYGVLAFGDSAYDDFCGYGRKLDGRLDELGAQRLLDRVDCEPDADSDADGWLERVLALVAAAPEDESPSPSPISEPTGAGGNTPAAYSRKNPLMTTVARNVRLSLAGSQKDVRNVGLHLPEGTLNYRTGDSLGVWPRNDARIVEEWLSLTGLDGDAVVTAPAAGPRGGGEMPLRIALRDNIEFTKISQGFLAFVAERSGDEDLAELLPNSAESAADRATFKRWSWGRQTLDVLAAHPVTASAQDWVDALKPLTPRSYSIASSPLVSPDEVQLTMSRVHYNLHGSPRSGVCSTFLANLPGAGHPGDNPGDEVGVFLNSSNHFRPPSDPETPMIMIGPGTGIAPFRAFLQERQALGHPGKNWLFFGEQHSAYDFYYRDELLPMLSDGHLTRLDVAFSRDQRSKVYVQDRMREHGAELYAWLREGAHIYVCGDAARMAVDVDTALSEVIAQHGKLAPASAEQYIKALLAEKRYVRDVY